MTNNIIEKHPAIFSCCELFMGIALIVIVLTSCKNSKSGGNNSNNSDGFMEAKIGGVKMQFSNNLSAQLSSDKTHIVVGGHLTSDPLSDSYDFEIFHAPAVVTTGTYGVPGTPNLITRYAHQNMVNGKVTGTTIFNASTGSGGTTSNAGTYTLVVTYIDDKKVAGTFTGHLQLLGGSSFVDVTEGSFSVPFH
jgi:hypothetical protein